MQTLKKKTSSTSSEDNNAQLSLFIFNENEPDIDEYIHRLADIDKRSILGSGQSILNIKIIGSENIKEIPIFIREEIKKYIEEQQKVYFLGIKVKKLEKLYEELQITKNIEERNKPEFLKDKNELNKVVLEKEEIQQEIEKKEFNKTIENKIKNIAEKELKEQEKNKEIQEKQKDKEGLWKEYEGNRQEEMYGQAVNYKEMNNRAVEDFENRGFSVDTLTSNEERKDNINNYHGKEINGDNMKDQQKSRNEDYER